MGIIASETDQSIVLKFAGGITAPYEKESILDRSTEPVSMMPAGLQRSMTTQELVDLIEYLTSLKKAEKH
jgi:putative heme-binding domain-containing protein